MLRTRSGLPKHCGWNTDHHGKRRVRFRKAGFSTYLTGTPWSEDFMRQYAAALEGVKGEAGEIGAARTKAGSFNALCVSYYRSPEFRGLQTSTQAVRRRVIEGLRVEHGDKPLKGLGRAHIKAIIGAKASTPEAANNLLKVLRTLLAYAVDIEMMAINPATGIKGFKSRGDGFHTWSETEVATFEARHPIGTKARLALELLLGTGQRRGDVVRMGWQHVKGGTIAVRQEKTDEPLTIPIIPNLATALAALPRTNMTFLVTENGKPFTAAGFGNWFRGRCDEAGLPQCSAHGLRKLAATRLANVGCSHSHIKAVTGHRSDSALAPYIRAANQERLAHEAMEMLEQSRTKPVAQLSNLETRLDKTGEKS
jgi:integrase